MRRCPSAGWNATAATSASSPKRARRPLLTRFPLGHSFTDSRPDRRIGHFFQPVRLNADEDPDGSSRALYQPHASSGGRLDGKFRFEDAADLFDHAGGLGGVFGAALFGPAYRRRAAFDPTCPVTRGEFDACPIRGLAQGLRVLVHPLADHIV